MYDYKNGILGEIDGFDKKHTFYDETVKVDSFDKSV